MKVSRACKSLVKIGCMLRQIQRMIREGRYRATTHLLNDSLRDDGCTLPDALNAILEGELTEVFNDDSGGQRYEVTGPTLDNYEMGVVCKFTADSRTLILITSYVL